MGNLKKLRLRLGLLVLVIIKVMIFNFTNPKIYYLFMNVLLIFIGFIFGFHFSIIIFSTIKQQLVILNSRNL